MKAVFCLVILIASITAAWADSNDIMTAELTDGQKISGRIVSESDTELELELPTGEIQRIPQSSIAAVRLATVDEIPRAVVHDPAAGHYLLSPSAFRLKAGQMNFTQTQLAVSQLTYGVTDNLSVQVGAVLPVLLDVPHVQLEAQWGMDWTPEIRWAVGANTVWGSIAGLTGGAALPFIVVTAGGQDTNISVFFSPELTFGDAENYPHRAVLATLSWKLRIRSGVFALYDIVYGYQTDEKIGYVIPVTGIRFAGAQFSCDLGIGIPPAAFRPLESRPFPWLNLSSTF